MKHEQYLPRPKDYVYLLAALFNSIYHMGFAGNGQKNMNFKSIVFFLPKSNTVRKSRMYFLCLQTACSVQLTWGKSTPKWRGDFKLREVTLLSKTWKISFYFV